MLITQEHACKKEEGLFQPSWLGGGKVVGGGGSGRKLGLSGRQARQATSAGPRGGRKEGKRQGGGRTRMDGGWRRGEGDSGSDVEHLKTEIWRSTNDHFLVLTSSSSNTLIQLIHLLLNLKLTLMKMRISEFLCSNQNYAILNASTRQ
jgi:hypothetical protein